MGLALLMAIRGLLQGTVRQAFAILGVLCGFWSLCVVSQWVGMHWQGARPAAVFWVLRLLVAMLAGLAVASLFQWFGEMVYEAVKKSLVGWLDRVGGFFLGAGIGAAIAGLALIAMLALPWPKISAGLAAQARFTPVAIRSARWVLDRSDRYVPGGDELRVLLRDAERRLRHAAQHS